MDMEIHWRNKYPSSFVAISENRDCKVFGRKNDFLGKDAVFAPIGYNYENALFLSNRWDALKMCSSHIWACSSVAIIFFRCWIVLESMSVLLVAFTIRTLYLRRKMTNQQRRKLKRNNNHQQQYQRYPQQ